MFKLKYVHGWIVVLYWNFCFIQQTQLRRKQIGKKSLDELGFIIELRMHYNIYAS